LIFPLELARKCADRWKLDSTTLNSQEQEENVIESSMSSELSELSVRSDDDAGE